MTADRPRSFFRLTTEPPDKKNRHTSRAKTDPLWAQLCAAMQEGVPDVLSPPAPTKKRKPRS